MKVVTNTTIVVVADLTTIRVVITLITNVHILVIGEPETSATDYYTRA